MSEHTTNSGGLVNHVVSPTTYFHSLSSNQMNGLATDLSDLAIGDRPPPRKIRRRNALTVQDPHFPHIVPPPNSPTHDAFEDSSRLQVLDEIVHRDFKHDNTSTTSSSSSVYSSCPLPPATTEPKRKIAANRRQRGPVIPGEDKEVRKILLHKDLEEFKVEGCLPEVLIQKYVKTVRSSFNNPCCALVPYQPPEKLITEILERDNNTGKSNKHGNSGEEEDDENSHMDMDD